MFWKEFTTLLSVFRYPSLPAVVGPTRNLEKLVKNTACYFFDCVYCADLNGHGH